MSAFVSFVRLCIVALLVSFPLQYAFCQSEIDADPDDDNQNRFSPYEPNYVIWQFTENDDPAMEVRYSFKYLFTDNDSTNGVPDPELYLKFSGEFDFYMGTRDSSPVINRVSNPGVHYRKYVGDKKVLGLHWKYFDIGLQHLSNGQALDAVDQQTLLQETYVADPDNSLFDDVSRSTNFFSVESSFRFGRTSNQTDYPSDRCGDRSGCYNLWLRFIPYYIDDDNPVTWGPDAGIRSDLADYDRLRTVLTKQLAPFGVNMEVGFEWKIGDELLDTDSFDLFVTWPDIKLLGLNLPLYIRYHNGPMNNLSDYTREQNFTGIGLRLY